MPKTTKTVTYESLKLELDTVMAELQSDDIDIDKALVLYKRGHELVKELEHYLQTAENKVQELKANFSNIA